MSGAPAADLQGELGLGKTDPGAERGQLEGVLFLSAVCIFGGGVGKRDVGPRQRHKLTQQGEGSALLQGLTGECEKIP